MKRSDGLLIALTAVGYPLGLIVGWRWLLPAANAAPAYVIMVRRLAAGDRSGAVRAMLLWAVCLAAFGTLAFTFWPHDPAASVIRGPEYRDEMLRWIRTGEGSEGDLRAFLPQHVAHLAVFVLASLASASAVSIVLGAVLMNYMSYYVASLARAGAQTHAVILLGWQPWAIARVAAFCLLGTVLAEPLLSRLWPYPYRGLGSARRTLGVAAGLIVADWAVKAALAPQWGLWLRASLPR